MIISDEVEFLQGNTVTLVGEYTTKNHDKNLKKKPKKSENWSYPSSRCRI